MKIRVFIVDGIIDSVRADEEALAAGVDVDIIDFDKNIGDSELLDEEFARPGFSPTLYDTIHCEPIMITSGDELENYVLEEYNKYDTELNSLFFDVKVRMPEREILKAYKSIQLLVNGDFVGRFHYTTLENGSLILGEEYEEFLPQGMYEDIYSGNCKDFLESFNENDAGIFRISDDELLPFIM